MRSAILAMFGAAALAAAEPAFSLQVEPQTLAIGGDNRLCWTIASAAGAAATITQSQVDRAVLNAYHRTNVDVWLSTAGRGGDRDPSSDHTPLPLPLQLYTTGWSRFQQADGKVHPGTYVCTWTLDGDVAPVTVELVPPAQAGRLVTAIPGPVQQMPALFNEAFDVRCTPAGPLPADAAFTATLVRPVTPDQSAGLPPGVLWGATVVEWTRLPRRAGDPTVVYSPIIAGGVAPLLSGKANPGAGVDPKTPRSFRLAEALRDPRLDLVVPGSYRIRLAACWLGIPAWAKAETLVILRSAAFELQVVPAAK